MANRRMISKLLLCEDQFTDMKVESRLLYIYMISVADDCGLVSGLKQLLFLTTATMENLKELIQTGYVAELSGGVYGIVHWYQSNRVQPTRSTGTIYLQALSEMEKNETYITCRQNVNKISTQSSQGESSQNKESQGKVKKIDAVLDGENKSLQMFFDDDNNKKVKSMFTDKMGALRNMKEYQILKSLIEIYGCESVITAIEIATTGNHKGNTVQYLKKVCDSQNQK
ncbi:MAG: hypothetical protein J5906_09215 [Acidaminococcaceae bacterium]|nr:hypothetical protein [Acidaminococcaceae bacterium]